MIARTDEQIVAWARSVVPDVDVIVAPPPEDGSTPGIFITLMAIAPVQSPRAARRPPRELALDYLVSTAGEDVSEAHEWLGHLVFGAMDIATWKVSTEPLPVELWQAFAVTPRPAFVVRVPLRVDRAEERAPLVRKPLVVDGSQIAHVSGFVIGPGDTPIAGATIELPSLQLFARTDPNGAFHFPTVPADTPMLVVVNAKGRVLQLRTRAGETLRIKLTENDLEE